MSNLSLVLTSSIADESTGTKKPAPKNARLKNISIGANSQAAAKAQTDSFTAEVFIKGLPNVDGQTPAEKTKIVITNADGENKTKDVSCLFCGSKIE